MAILAKYDGIDGESAHHEHVGWIDIAGVEWGAHREGLAATGSGRLRKPPTIDDMVLTFGYEKAAPKLLEKCLRGEVIGRLEVELKVPFEQGAQTYLRYDLENVRISSYHVNASGEAWARPVVEVGNVFEEIKVTYIHIDAHGNHVGSVETEYRVEAPDASSSGETKKKSKKKPEKKQKK